MDKKSQFKTTISPKRIIFYLVDAISAIKVRSFNSERINEVRNKNMPMTFFDKIYQESFVMKYCYGYDTTQSSLYTAITGQLPHESRISITKKTHTPLTMNLDLFQELKKKGYTLNYFTNNQMLKSLPAIPLRDFDNTKICSCEYSFEKVDVPKKFWGLETDQKTVVFIHDLHTHDQRGLFGQGKWGLSTKDYEDLIVQNADLIEKNLEFMKFNPKEDLLILFSDHGLILDTTFVPKGKAAFNKERLKLWAYSSQEMKSRVIFMARHDSIKPYENKSVGTLIDAFAYITKLLGITNYPSEAYKRFKSPDDALSLNFGIFPPTALALFHKRIFDDRFYQFLYVIGKGDNRKKWIYQKDLKKAEYYDLALDPLEENPKKITFDDLPQKMQDYIKEYYKTRASRIRSLLTKILIDRRI